MKTIRMPVGPERLQLGDDLRDGLDPRAGGRR